MAFVTVEYLINETAPKSEITYRPTSRPEYIIGFFNLGITTLVYIRNLFIPSDLAASSTVESRFLSALLQINKTYGYVNKVKTIQLPIKPSMPFISVRPVNENNCTNKPFGEKAEIYVKAPIYDGTTKGSVQSVNKIFEPAILNLIKTIDINKPKEILEKTTAKNIAIVLNNKPYTFHD